MVVIERVQESSSRGNQAVEEMDLKNEEKELRT